MRSLQACAMWGAACLLCLVACGSDTAPADSAEAAGSSGSSGMSGSAGEGGSAQAGTGGSTAGSGGEPAHPPNDLCDHLTPGAPGKRALAVDLSAAHASVRFFGTETSHLAVDSALLTASDSPWSVSSLSAYAAAIGDACFLKATDSILTETSVQSLGSIAIIHPGKGKPQLPAGATAVAVDLRDLPAVEGLREAIEGAVSLALSEPVPRPKLSVRKLTGMTDELFIPFKLAQGATYTSEIVVVAQAPIPAAAPSRLPLVLLTGSRLAPAAAEIAATLRLADAAWLVGEDVFTAVAETRWFGIGDHGIAHRDRMIGGHIPIADVIPADVRTASPEQHLEALSTADKPTHFTAVSGERKRLDPFLSDVQITPGAPEPATARAALLVAHGAARMFFPYFSVVGDTLDDALLGELSAIDVAPLESFSPKPFLQRLSWHLHDSHSWVYSIADSSDPPNLTGYVPVALDSGPAGEAIVRRSEIAEISRGDQIITVDGQPMDELLALKAAQLSSSTAGAATRDALAGAMMTSQDVTLELRAPDGTTRSVLIKASSLLKTNPASIVSNRKAGPLTDLGASDLYYVNLDAGALTDADSASQLAIAASSAKGLIIDARGYPGTLQSWELIRRIIKTPSSIKLNVDVITPLGREKTPIDQPWSPATAPRYDGEVVVLIGPSTQSQAEHILIPLVNETRATFLGRRTAGADGNITGVLLPGRQALSFTGMEVLFQDGSTFHGQGITPDVELIPTVASLASDPDPELSAAIALLK